MYVTLQELCQKLYSFLNSKYSIENINNISEYIYKSAYFRNKILKQDIAEVELIEEFQKIVTGLANGKPVQYCINEAVFMDLELFVDERVLIPRPETEELVDWCMEDFTFKKDSITVLDIGTGSGAIALSLAKKFPNWKVHAIDLSDEILEIVRLNANKYNINLNLSKVDFLNENYVLDHFDIIISNPPYISTNEKKLMSDSVLNYEPHSALFSPTADPDIFYKSIAEFGLNHLNINGVIYCELNEFRSQQIIDIFKNVKYSNIEIKNDLQNKPRMLKASLR